MKIVVLFLLSLPLVALFGCEKDHCSDINSNKISFTPSDSAKFPYRGKEVVRFTVDNKDTLTFYGGE
jgi:hypothetical protein